MIRKILIANRGEIACRIIRTARKLNIQTVAIYSDSDKVAEHVQLADEAYLVGPAPAKESYLNISKIIEIIKEANVDAVHPGYGFLSENADFANAVIAAGAIFIGPSPQIIKDMGDKLRAKEIARQAHVPLIPGTQEAVTSAHPIFEFAKKNGYPLLLKAAAGGGGKGMRVVYHDAEVEDALARTKSEALSSFGDDRIFIEKFIEHPRHIEVQILGDQHGNIFHFGERDCSLQRRHQKVVEETPAPNLLPSVRDEIISHAVKIAKHIGYYSAGTVEFVLAPDQKFYFLEVNTRLQVEHPVTEMLHGNIDLVELMIRIANGEKLALNQDSIRSQGHAIEVRLYAEDADNDFLPSCGRLTVYHPPTTAPSLRVDSGIREGDTISIFYDPMIAKIISYGGDRKEAIANLQSALSDTLVEGVDTNLNYLQRLLDDKDVKEGMVHTGLIAEKSEALSPTSQDSSLKEIISVISLCLRLGMEPALAVDKKWICVDGTGEVEIQIIDDNLYQIEDQLYHTAFKWTYQKSLFQVKINEATYNGKASYRSGHCHITLLGRTYSIFVERKSVWQLLKHLPKKNIKGDLNQITSPMPGILLSLNIAVGDKVQKGQTVAVIEAMKMENTLKSPMDGIITEITVSPKDSLAKGQIIAKIVV